MATASGTFDVRIEPAEHDQVGIGRMNITKTWHGDLVGEGVGTMLSAGDPHIRPKSDFGMVELT